jgi:hypothetical protein
MLENLFWYILYYSFLLPPILYFLLLYKTSKNIRMLTIVFYCFSIFMYLLVFEEYALIHIPKKIRYPLFTLLEYSFFSILVFQQLRSPFQRILLIVLSICFFLFEFIYYNYLTIRKKIDSIPIGIETILIFIFIFFFLYEQLKDAKELPIYENYFFWITIGLFIYLGGSFFIYLMANSMTKSEIDQYWFFTYIVEFIKNILFSASIFIYSKNPNNNKSTPVIPNLDFML